jgi:hypothetical protein
VSPTPATTSMSGEVAAGNLRFTLHQCDNVTMAGSATFTTEGVALPPFAGNFLETGTVGVTDSLEFSFSSSFRITDPVTGDLIVSGTKHSDALTPGIGVFDCQDLSGPLFTLQNILFAADVRYSATIHPAHSDEQGTAFLGALGTVLAPRAWSRRRVDSTRTGS